MAARRGERTVALEEVKRMRRPAEALRARSFVKVVPQADHLARTARRQQAQRAQRMAACRRHGRREHVAGVFGDGFLLDDAETLAAFDLKSDP
jgi:hypothetical protein